MLRELGAQAFDGVKTFGKKQRRSGFKPIDAGARGDVCGRNRFFDVGEIKRNLNDGLHENGEISGAQFNGKAREYSRCQNAPPGIGVLQSKFMRLDLFLKHTGLVKRRAVAKEMCDGGRVSRNGKKAQPADEVHLGDTLAISYGARRLEAKVLDVPRGQVPKEKRENYFQVTSETKVEDDW